MQAIVRIWKGYNRFLCARILGDYRVPTSFHLGKIKPYRAWVRALCKGLSFLFRDKAHCSTVAEKNMQYTPIDPTGKYAGILIILNVVFDIFLLYAAFMYLFI